MDFLIVEGKRIGEGSVHCSLAMKGKRFRVRGVCGPWELRPPAGSYPAVVSVGIGPCSEWPGTAKDRRNRLGVAEGLSEVSPDGSRRRCWEVEDETCPK